MKSRPDGAEPFHPDRRTHVRTVMTNPVIAFRNYANASENELINNNKHTRICGWTAAQWVDTQILRNPRRDHKILNASSVTWP